MMIQNQINRSLNAPAARVRLKQILAQSNGASRSAVGRRVCEAFDFADQQGRLQLSGCMKALRALEGAGEIQLPAARCAARPRHRGVLREHCRRRLRCRRVSAVADLAIVLVETDEQRRAWSTLIAEEHPRGMTTFAGCQLRYLVTSAHGWLAAVGFSASALRVASRERWMAWSDEQRKGHLHRVLCMSRFLIRPSVSCTHLASYVLGRVLRRLARDFEASLRLPSVACGDLCRAAAGGGELACGEFPVPRADRWTRASGSTQSSCGNTQVSLHLPVGTGLAPSSGSALCRPRVLVPGDGLDSERWARMEFGGAPLGDKRLTARLVRSAELLAAYPGRAMCGTAKTDRQAVDGYYRFIEQPQESAVTVENILKPHRARSIQRMRSQRTVLAIQDGTDLNFAGARTVRVSASSARTRPLRRLWGCICT